MNREPKRAYLDHAGGAPVLDEVRAALAALPEANPQSPHAEGRAARAALDNARDRAAAALGANSGDVVFCSGGTEAVNLALLGAGRRLPAGRRVVTWEAEHQSVLGAVRQLQVEGHPVAVVAVDAAARADPGALPDDAGLVSIGLANNEVGTLQPVAEIAGRAHELGALVHLDACQGPAWVRPPVELADLVSLSGHKLGAGRGGLLLVPREIGLQPLQLGGPQEWGRRPGREDLAAATAVTVALEICAASRAGWSEVARPRAQRLRDALHALGGRPTGGESRLPNFATAAFGRCKGEDLLLGLDLAGVAASSGSACASGSLDPSHVLLAMGLSLAEALGSLRLTVGPQTTDAEVEQALTALNGIAALA
ncbi:MAG TPA: aminotransferase class V-fold PLP-dependent enzyme [Candidatus Dormibacteraeota bacterium]